MSFLDNVKRVSEQAAEEKVGEKKPVNPLLRFKKKAAEDSSNEEQKENSNSMLERLRKHRAAEKAEAEAEKKEEEPKKESIQERAESVVKAVLEKDEKTEEEPEKKSEPVEEKTEDSAKIEEKEETPVEAEEKKEIPAKETAEEEPKKEETESLLKEVENEPTAEEAESKKRRRRAGRPKGSKNKASKEKAEEETEEKEELKVEAPSEEAIEEEKPSEEVAEEETPFSYKEAAGEVLSYYIDDEWKEKEKELDERLSNIRVDGDMNSGTIRFAIGELNRFNDEIRLLCVEQEQLLDILTNKEYGKAPVIASKAKGKNETERKCNAYELMAHYRQPGSDHTINLITLIQAVKLRVTFLRRICGDIDRKSDRCITFQNALKTEASLIQ